LTPPKLRTCGVSAEKLISPFRDEIGDKAQPEWVAVVDVAIGEGDENPTGELGEGGFRDVSCDAVAGGMPARPPNASIDLHGDLSIWPGKISSKWRGLT
jgi:hypothetical protein